MAAARREYPGPRGVVVGEAYRPDLDMPGVRHKPGDPKTWGKGGKAPLLIDPCDEGSTHSMRIAGPGGNKTASVVTMLAHPDAAWPGSAFVLDPSDEIGPLCREAREALGQRVVMLDLAKPGSGMDVLADVDPGSPRAVRDVLSITAELCGEEQSRQRDAIFDNAGRNLIACVLAHMLSDPAVPPEHKTLHTFLEGITVPEGRMKGLLKGIYEQPREAGDSLGRTAGMLAGIVLGLAEETFSGAYFNATQFVAWLFDSQNADLLAGRGFRPSELADGGLTVFCHIPLETLMHAPGVARVVTGSVVRAMIAADGRHKQRLLMVTDERRRLGRMIAMEVARDQGRKYGITLHDIYQSNAQVKEVSGPGGPDAWFNALSWRSYGSIADAATARDLSEMCGEYAVLATSDGDNKGTSGRPFEWGSKSRGSNTSTHEIKRRLIKVEEILQDMRSDEQIVVRPGSKPLRCGLAAYYRRPEVMAWVGENRFVQRHEENAA
jgi:type IV secretion system protein VirD4